jgi:hypothetical protein
VVASEVDDSYILHIGADLNASLGIRSDYDITVDPAGFVGSHGISGTNGRGRLVEKYLERMGLCSVTSFFQSSDFCTWESFKKDDKPRQVDFALMRRMDLKRVS